MLIEASAELAAAETAQAPRLAPFEFVAAEEYLHKAREEQSYADFEVAEVLAKKARDCARLSRAFAEARTRTDLGASPTAPIPTGLECEPAGRTGSFARPTSSVAPATQAPGPQVAPASTNPAPASVAPGAAQPTVKKKKKKKKAAGEPTDPSTPPVSAPKPIKPSDDEPQPEGEDP